MNRRVFINIAFALILASNGFAQDANTVNIVTPGTVKRIITVGGEDSDISGFTNQAIQIAMDALPAEGGTIKLNPGVFEIIAPVSVSSNVNLIGFGQETILKISDGVHALATEDADYGELKVTVDDPTGFGVGMALQITDSVWFDCWDVIIVRITAIEGNTLHLNDYLIRDYTEGLNIKVNNATSGIEVIEGNNVTISDLVIDGNKEKSASMDGCKGGGIFVHKSKYVTIENVEIKNYNGEGISWQMTENVAVRNCHIHHNAKNGLHPGSGSPGTIIENNESHHNGFDGLFICWRVSNSIVKGNKFYNNNRWGICTGHRDSDVLFENNHIYGNGDSGVRTRRNTPKNAPHNNTFINNVIENNSGYGFHFDAPAKGVILENNIIRDTGKGTQKAAIFYDDDSIPVELINNEISGHPGGDIKKVK